MKQVANQPFYVKEVVSLNALKDFNNNKSLNELIADASVKMEKKH